MNERLTEWREAAGLSSTEMAARIGIDLATYSNIENGRYHPGLTWVFKIEDATSGDIDAREWAREPRRKNNGKAA